MSILCDSSLLIYANTGHVKPIEKGQINPASIDLRLSNEWIDISTNRPKKLDSSAVILYPRSSYYTLLSRLGLKYPTLLLASTLEWIEISENMYGMVKLKTTPTREGLGHPIADWIDPGFAGQLTLMLHAFKPIRLRAGDRVCQLVIGMLDGAAARPYSKTGHYMNQTGPTLSWREKHVL